MKTILILDDNKACSATLKMSLMNKGYEVHRTTKVQLLVNPAWNDKFDLILINFAFANASGWVVFNHFSQVSPHLPAMVYVMDHPDTSTTVWIVRAVEAVINETNHHSSRWPGVAPTSAENAKCEPHLVCCGDDRE
jgi:DNA-binding NtrC family response regulator